MGSSGDRMNRNEKKKLMVKMKRMKSNLETKFFEFKTLCGVEGCMIYLQERPNGDEIQSTLPETPSDLLEILKLYMDAGPSSITGKGKRKFDHHLSRFDEKPTTKKKMRFDDEKQSSSENCFCPEFQSSMEFEKKLESGLAGIRRKESNLLLNHSSKSNPVGYDDDDKKKKGKLIADDDGRTVVVNPSSEFLGFDGQPWLLSNRDGASTSSGSHDHYVMNDPSIMLGFDRTADDQSIIDDWPTTSTNLGYDQMFSLDCGEMMMEGQHLNFNGNTITTWCSTENEDVMASNSVSNSSGFESYMTLLNHEYDQFELPPLDDDLSAITYLDDTSYDPTMMTYYSRVDDDNDDEIASLIRRSDCHNEMGMIMSMINTA